MKSKHTGAHRPLVVLASVGSVALVSIFSSTQAVAQRSVALEEIIVTAEKRELNLQKVPQTVNVVSATELTEAGVTQVQNIQEVVPGVTIANNSNATGPASGGSRDNITVRGVAGANGGDPSTQPSVATIIDGVYSQAGIAGAGGLFDIGQVELAKGPQGTIFGRNATTGALIVTTQKPKFENSGQVSVDLGNYSKTNAFGVINFMISDALAVRAAAQSSRRNGYYKDGFSNDDAIGSRVRVLFKPNEDVSLLVTGNYSKERGRGNGSTLLNNNTGKPVSDPWGPQSPSATDASIWGALYARNPSHDNRNYSVIPQLDWVMGPGTLTVIASYNVADSNEVGPTYQGLDRTTKERSFEARMASNDDNARLKWLGGVSYYDQKLTGTQTWPCAPAAGASAITTGGAPDQYDFSKTAPAPTVVIPGIGTILQGNCQTMPQANVASNPTIDVIIGANNKETNYAAFTQETFSVVDRLRLTAGARWQYEKASRGRVSDLFYSGTTLIPSTPSAPNPAPSGRAYGEADWKAITWRAGVDFDVTQSSLAYAMVSTGWKAGTPMQYAAPFDQQRPEKLTAFTVGSKNRFLEDKLQVNAEVFYWLFKDRQIINLIPVSFPINPATFPVRNPDGSPATQAIVSIPGSGTVVFTQGNAAKSHVQGVSADIAYRPVVSDTLGVSAEYLDEALHDDMGGNAVNGCLSNCTPDGAPKWSATGLWRHVFDVGDRGRYAFDARTKYESSKLLSIAGDRLTVAGGRLDVTQPSYFMSSAGLGYSPSAGMWNVRAYVDNIENKVIKTSASVPSAPAFRSTATLMPPRTYGVQLRADF